MQFLNFRKNKTKKTIVLFSVLLIFCFLVPTIVIAQKQYVVVLDAGHGGKDTGASRGRYVEKKIALNLTLKVGELLKKTTDNIKVVYTRSTDVFIELHKRASIANSNNADLFVSIHCNANNSPKPYGAETYVLGLNGNKTNLEIAKKENAVILLEDDYKSNYDYDPNSPESVIGLSVLQEENLDQSVSLADLLQTNFANLKRYDRSVKQANFLVLRETVMPSVLIELGFLSNVAEGRFLNSKTGQTKMAKAVAKAITDYIHYLKVNTVKEGVVTNEVVKTPKKEEPVAVAKTTPKKIVKKTPKKVVKPKTVTPKVVKVKKKQSETVVSKPKPKKNVKSPSVPHIEFKVQIGASKQYLEPKPYNFKGLQDVEVKTYNDYYRYYYGSSSDLQTIKEYQQEARSAGIKEAFVVAFENGEKISVREAIQKQR